MALPWGKAPSEEQYFVLVTGVNSGVGLGIGLELIDKFLSSRSLNSHLILIITTRSPTKSRETITTLRAHLETLAHTSQKLRSRGGPGYDAKATVSRVHLLSVQVDLCKLKQVYEAADRLLHGQVRDPTGVTADGKDVTIPRLDVAIWNAGIGGWSGVDFLAVFSQFLTVGIPQSVTWPNFKTCFPTDELPPQELCRDAKALDDKAQPTLGSVFCANDFGHYILGHEILPLLSRPSDSKLPPARVLWMSSLEGVERHMNLDDLQGLKSNVRYESSKRLTDLLVLGLNFPSVQKVASSYFEPPTPPPAPVQKPRFYLTHPGITNTSVLPLPAILAFAWLLLAHLVRLWGSCRHVISLNIGACSTVWLALEHQSALDSRQAHRVKWGSACDRRANGCPKTTEVEGWGWEGRVGELETHDAATGVLSRAVGRRWDAAPLTEERLERFERDAQEVWAQMERLRRVWEGVLGRKAV